MRDRREPLSTGPIEDEPGADVPGPGPRRFGRVVATPAVRRLAVSRIGRTLLIVAGLAGLVGLAGASAWRSVRDWLHRHDDYQVDLNSIRLDPEPPGWLKGGRARLLDPIRDDLPALGRVSILDLKAETLLGELRLNPWVASASRLTKEYPNRLAVTIGYRVPVIRIDIEPDRADLTPEHYLADPDGVALAASDVDPAWSRRLLRLVLPRDSTRPRLGTAWPNASPSGAEPSRIDPVREAVTLAGFLDGRTEPSPGSTVPLRPRPVVFTAHRGGFWVQFDDGTWVLWHEGTGSKPGDPSDPAGPTEEQKWAWLVDRSARLGSLGQGDPRRWLWFNQKGVHEEISAAAAPHR